jgi:hypothetical protein
MSRGIVDQMSFAFTIGEARVADRREDDDENEDELRTIIEIGELYDVCGMRAGRVPADVAELAMRSIAQRFGRAGVDLAGLMHRSKPQEGAEPVAPEETRTADDIVVEPLWRPIPRRARSPTLARSQRAATRMRMRSRSTTEGEPRVHDAGRDSAAEELRGRSSTELREQRKAAAEAYDALGENATEEQLRTRRRRVRRSGRGLPRHRRTRSIGSSGSLAPVRTSRHRRHRSASSASRSPTTGTTRSARSCSTWPGRVQPAALDSAGARERIKRHRPEMDVELKERRERASAASTASMSGPARRARAQQPRLARKIADSGMLVEKRAITRVDGAGGEFVPPLWLLDEYAAAQRALRPFADEVRNIPLPAGTDSINVPRITTGSLTGVQTADNAAVTAQDLVTATVTAPVRTIAGQVDAAMQLLDQSPIAFDEIVFEDLIADYAMQLDIQLLERLRRVRPAARHPEHVGINAITYTDATPTVPELYPKLADALNQASNNRKRVPDALLDARPALVLVRIAARREQAVLRLDGERADERARRAAGLAQPGRPCHRSDRRAGLPRPEHPHEPRGRHERGPDRRDDHARPRPVRGRPATPRAEGDPLRNARRALPGVRVLRVHGRPVPRSDERRVGHRADHADLLNRADRAASGSSPPSSFTQGATKQ